MTAIASVVDSGKVWMGGDGQVSCGYEAITNKQSKVWEKGDFLFGFTGTMRGLQLLRYVFTPPPLSENLVIESYLAGTFADGVQSVMKNGGFAKVAEGQVTFEGTFLIGFRGRLFTFSDDCAFTEPSCGYYAIGCGGEFATGSLHSTQGEPPEQRVTKALEAASMHSMGVSPPFTILSK